MSVGFGACIHHFSFTVSDLDRSVEFYTSVFGFAASRPSRELNHDWISLMTAMPGTILRIQFLELEETELELIEYVSPVGKQHCDTQTCDTGSAHVAFHIESLDEALVAAERLGARRVADPVEIPEGPWIGRRVAYLRDPDGIVVELVEFARSERINGA